MHKYIGYDGRNKFLAKWSLPKELIVSMILSSKPSE